MEITEIKTRLSILEVLTHYHLQPNQNQMLCCPFHEDKTPSLQVYPLTNTFCCFSSNCKAGTGDVVEFIRLMEKCSKHEAILKAASLIRLHSVPDGQVQTTTTTMHDTVTTQALSRTAVLTKFYQTCTQGGIARSAKAREYAEKRMLKFEQLGIGYMGPDFYKSWNETMKASAVNIGLLKKTSDGYSHKFRYCLVFVMKNRQGQIVDIYARSLNDEAKQSLPAEACATAKASGDTRSGAGRHFYLPGNHQGLYPAYPKPETEKLILTESIIDAATLIQHPAISSQYSILACYGTNGFTEEHEQAISELEQLEEVILFFDGDEAGRKGAAALTEKLRTIKASLRITTINTPEGEDVNSLAQNHPDQSGEIFTHLLTNRSASMQEAGKLSFSIEKEKTLSTPLPATSKLHTENPELLFYENGVLNITVLGGIRITGMDRMRVTLKLERKTFDHLLPMRHNLDLYNKGQVDQLCTQAAETLDVGTQEAVHAIAGLTNALEKYRETKLEALKPRKEEKRKLTDQEKRETLEYLKSSELMKRTLQDISKSGIVGEKLNSMIAWLTYTSRKREKPLHLMCLGASGTGKTYLQEKISQLMPEEDKLEITTLSENAFYYFGQEELKHKLILIEDLDGAGDVLYPLRELQTKTSITKTVTLKDNKGNLKTITLKVEGPVCVSSCTTREKIYEDNANRCILIYIDTTAEQDKRIMEYQQHASAGMVNRMEENAIKEKLKNVQRLLRPVQVRNPYANHINLPEAIFKPRRTMLLLLSFIETITFYHQFQREVKQDKESGEHYIESTAQDVEYGFKLLKEVLFSKSDELSGACRKFFEQLKAHLKKESLPAGASAFDKSPADRSAQAWKESFYAASIRKALRLNPNNLKRYLIELSRHGYIKISAGSKYKGYEYQITDFSEYEQLKSSIDRKLEEILLKIKSSSVVQ